MNKASQIEIALLYMRIGVASDGALGHSNNFFQLTFELYKV